MMKLEIRELEIPFFLGFYAEEKLRKTKVIFNILLEFDETKFLKSKKFEDLIDYDSLIKKINSTFESADFDLIEDVLLETAKILSVYNLLSYEIKISKQGTHPNVEKISISKKFTLVPGKPV